MNGLFQRLETLPQEDKSSSECPKKTRIVKNVGIFKLEFCKNGNSNILKQIENFHFFCTQNDECDFPQ